jgi:hypothetical protein
MGVHVTFLPPYGYSSLIAYRRTACSSFPSVPALDVVLWFGLSLGDHSPTATTAPSLSAIHIYLHHKHNRSEMVAVLGPYEALPYYIHTVTCRMVRVTNKMNSRSVDWIYYS